MSQRLAPTNRQRVDTAAREGFGAKDDEQRSPRWFTTL